MVTLRPSYSPILAMVVRGFASVAVSVTDSVFVSSAIPSNFSQGSCRPIVNPCFCFSDLLKSFEGLCRLLSDCFRGFLESIVNLEHAGGRLRGGCQPLEDFIPPDCAVSGPEVGIAVAIVVVQMRGTDASLQFGQNRCYALGEVRVSDIETDSNIGEVSGVEDLEDVCRTCDIVLQVFDQQLYSERAGKGAQMLERSHRELKGPRAPGVLALAEVDNEEPKGNLLGDFEGARDFVHAIDASGLLRIDDVDAGSTAAAHFVIGIER